MAAHCSRDKRRAPRIEISLPARITISRSGGAISEKTQLINASAVGVYLGSNKDIHPGEELEISIGVPGSVYTGSPAAEFTGSATIVWVNRESPPPGKRLGIGIRFDSGLTFNSVSGWLFLAGIHSG